MEAIGDGGPKTKPQSIPDPRARRGGAQRHSSPPREVEWRA
jgi:hypothetical protein